MEKETPVQKASKILSKEEDLTLEDYNEFIRLSKLPMNKEEKFELSWSWLFEGMYQRTPEIASQTGSYDFMKDEDWGE